LLPPARGGRLDDGQPGRARAAGLAGRRHRDPAADRPHPAAGRGRDRDRGAGRGRRARQDRGRGLLAVAWTEVFLVLIVSHLVGDFLLQPAWQAKYKYGGLSADPVRRRALGTHIVTYMLAFGPALVWIAAEGGLARAVLAAIVVAVPHWVQDDGRL